MNTAHFSELFIQTKPLIGMIHVQALPGTPANRLEISEIARQATKEARILASHGMQAVMLENMHDLPYLNRSVGPEIIAAMTRVACEVREAIELPIGIQILAAANQAALAVAQAAELQFIRAEGFVFAHIADEGFIPSDAAELLRYRKCIGAEQIHIFTDIKKKHSSHAISADVSIEDTLHAAEFFLSDGVIISGSKTGSPVDHVELAAVYREAAGPVLVGSGLNPENLAILWDHSDGFIVGSYFKEQADWRNGPDPQRIEALAQARLDLAP